jgi:hypothetical protein
MDKRSGDPTLSTYYLQKQIMASEKMSYSYLQQNICQPRENYNRNLESTPIQPILKASTLHRTAALIFVWNTQRKIKSDKSATTGKTGGIRKAPKRGHIEQSLVFVDRINPQ